MNQQHTVSSNRQNLGTWSCINVKVVKPDKGVRRGPSCRNTNILQGYPSKKSLRGGYAPSRMRPKTKRWREFPRLVSQRNGSLSPSEKSSALTWQARGDQHQNRSITGEIFSKPWSDPHTASMPWPGRACGVSHPHLKQREGDGKSEAWPPEIETTWTRPWECNPA